MLDPEDLRQVTDEDGACTIGVWEYKRNASDGDKWARCWCPCKSFRSVIGEK